METSLKNLNGQIVPNENNNANQENNMKRIENLSISFVDSLFNGTPLPAINQPTALSIENQILCEEKLPIPLNPPTLHHQHSVKSGCSIKTNEASCEKPKTRTRVTSSSKPSAKKKGTIMIDQHDSNDNLSSTVKVTKESEKERKAYEHKYYAMKNRINALRKQEDELNKKMSVHQNKVKELEIIKADKDAFKNCLSQIKVEKSKTIEQKKQRNTEERIRVKLAVKESINKLKIKKQAEFDIARSEKQMVASLITDSTEQMEIEKYQKIERLKIEAERIKEEEKRRQKELEEKNRMEYEKKKQREILTTEGLKAQIAEMEKQEDKIINSLKITQKATYMMFKGIPKHCTPTVIKIEEETNYTKINDTSNKTNTKKVAKTQRNMARSKSNLGSAKDKMAIIQIGNTYECEPYPKQKKFTFNPGKKNRLSGKSVELYGPNINSNTSNGRNSVPQKKIQHYYHFEAKKL